MAESQDHVSCSEVVELVTDYLERSLPPEQAALVEQHLNFCEGCLWYVDQIRTTVDTSGASSRTKFRPRSARSYSRHFATGGARDRLQVPPSQRH